MGAIPEVLESTQSVAERARHVHIDMRALQAWIAKQDPAGFQPPATPRELQFTGDRGACANLSLLLNSLNFCFWSERPWTVAYRGRTWTRTYAMFAAVLRAIERDGAWLSPQCWANADAAKVARLFSGEGEIPLVAERRTVLNETGRILCGQFEGRFTHAVEKAGGHARRLAHLLAAEFSSFRDIADYDGEPIAFLKRAQLCAAEVDRAWRRCGEAGLDGIDELTVFADYRLPQYLRHVGIVQLDAEFAARITRREEIPCGSREEIELRAATVWAGELIRRELHGTVSAAEIDFVLWLRSHDPAVRIEHHRTRTVCY